MLTSSVYAAQLERYNLLLDKISRAPFTRALDHSGNAESEVRGL